MRKTFGLDGEPRENHKPPEPFWATGAAKRDGVKDDFANLPRERFEKERAERMRKSAAAKARSVAARAAEAAGEHGIGPGVDMLRGRLGDAEFIRTIGENDDGGEPGPEGGILVEDSMHLRSILFGDADEALGGRYFPSSIQVRWVPDADKRPLGGQGVALLGMFIQRVAIAYGYSLGLNVASAGWLAMGCGKTKAADIAKELKPYGGLHRDAVIRWFQDRAMALIDDGSVPEGINAETSDQATAFYLALAGEKRTIWRWLETVKPQVKIDAERLEESLDGFTDAEYHGLLYLIQSNRLLGALR